MGWPATCSIVSSPKSEGNFVASVAWRSSDFSNHDAKQFSVDKNPDNDPNGPWFAGNLSSPNPRENLRYEVESPTGRMIQPPNNGWRWKRDTMSEMVESGKIIFSADGSRLIRKTYLKDQSGLAPSNLWSDIEDTGHNRNAKYELKKLFPECQTSELFKTPKPLKFWRWQDASSDPSD